MKTQVRHDLTDAIRNEQWDAIVIGSGLGGLTAAVGLANKGKKTVVIEQHFIPGGYATCFKRKGFVFDVSLHQMPGIPRG